MKNTLLWILALFLVLESSKAQNVVSNQEDSIGKILGTYQFATGKYTVRKRDEKLIIDFPGQGYASLTQIAGNKFRADHVNPEAIIEFLKDSLGRIFEFRWSQDVGLLKWTRVKEEGDSPVTNKQKDSAGGYEGRYRDQKKRMELVVREEEGKLKTQVTGEGTQLDFLPVSADHFMYKSEDLQIFINFQKKEKGKFHQIIQTRTGPLSFVKIPEEDNAIALVTRSSNRQNGFTRADSLRGMLTPLRTCYDVLFYKLDVKVDPDSRIIKGTTGIRFRAMEDFQIMQVDLYANMKIEHIRFKNMENTYTREFNAVFVQFPATIRKGEIAEIDITYAGQPQVADFSTLTGGFIWYHDKNGKPWIESVCQGAGASLWWPCKDHLSDKPDSMQISVTVPKGLTEISNGKLKGKTDLPGDLTRFDWYVSYPITNYNVVVNIGDYVHFSDQLVNYADTLALNYYCLSYDKAKAEQVFQHVKPMLALYTERFGDYPFAKDGFTAMESLYPMEHQGAVSIGSINNPVNSNKFDRKELIRTMWHEVSHEWWGNSITCSDMADLWIHEAFATYTETLNYEFFAGKQQALKHLTGEPPENKEPIIGIYNVNNFHLGDMYSKGALMLHTLRSVIASDSIFFNLLKGLQSNFRYQSVNTEMIVNYVNEFTKTDFTAFFDQYLKYEKIPELDLRFTSEGDRNWLVQYRWKTDAKGFNIPVRVTQVKNEWTFIYPKADWQQISLKDLKPADFKVDTENFYITVRKE
ncbi:MAG TPA: M1 family metallopeptidase [Chryseolinea sp.]|nr:M1 family metallopeptidase [Chryseolinea sp.]